MPLPLIRDSFNRLSFIGDSFNRLPLIGDSFNGLLQNRLDPSVVIKFDFARCPVTEANSSDTSKHGVNSRKSYIIYVQKFQPFRPFKDLKDCFPPCF
ncbi:hypothetical protein L1887_05120 [Cichorium endivia]|nr:hypothetical protein L1887_05120 [Cichorium endivia]